MKCIYSWLFLLAFTFPALAQQEAEIFGKVIDATNDQPVEFVTVYLKDTNVATNSDEKGNYRLKVPAGSE